MVGIAVKRLEQSVAISIRGNFGINLWDEFRDKCLTLEPGLQISLDLADVTHIETNAFGMMLLLWERQGGEESDISFVTCAPTVCEFLYVVQGDRWFKCTHPPEACRLDNVEQQLKHDKGMYREAPVLES